MVINNFVDLEKKLMEFFKIFKYVRKVKIFKMIIKNKYLL